MIAALGGLATLAGYGLGAEGKRQGANSLRNEAHRQTMEQLNFDLSRFDPIDQNIAQSLPGHGIEALTGQNARLQSSAMLPAAQAGGSALGVRPTRVFSPGMQVQNVGAATGQADSMHQLETARMGLSLAEIERKREMARALYEGRMLRAGRKGQGLRQTGEILGALGSAGMAYGMGQEATPKAAAPSGSNVGGYNTNIETGEGITEGLGGRNMYGQNTRDLYWLGNLRGQGATYDTLKGYR